MSAPALSSHTLATSRNDIDIWLSYYGDIEDDQRLDELRKLLTPDEVIQERGFHFADDRKRYLVTRAMVRTILSRYVPIAPGRWKFSTNSYGRPRIAEEIAIGQPSARDLVFNISHTRGLIALAIARGRDLGVDVENAAARCVSLDVARAYFSPDEVDDLFRTPSDLQQDRFFEYWTFKESYIKARGMGLSLPLDRFSFQFPSHDAVRLCIDPDLDDHAERWSLWQYRPTPDYLLAICAERNTGPQPTVSIRNFNLHAAETPPLSATPRRCSDSERWAQATATVVV
jgi:4'-phosphopantetheinyl transferase